jgi:hypothetical protein
MRCSPRWEQMPNKSSTGANAPGTMFPNLPDRGKDRPLRRAFKDEMAANRHYLAGHRR